MNAVNCCYTQNDLPLKIQNKTDAVVKFNYSEKDTKIWKGIPPYKVLISKQGWRFLQILWTSHWPRCEMV